MAAQTALFNRLLQCKELHIAGCSIRRPTARVLVRLGLAFIEKGYLVLK